MKCSIIALGDSLRGFDFSTIEGYKITLNNGYKYVPHNMVVWFDPPPKVDKLETLDVWGGRWIKGEERDIIRDVKHVANCNSSLILAVNIAINLGFKEIDIYGSDFKCFEYAHFYDEEKLSPKKQKELNTCYMVIEAMFKKLTFLEDEIINFK